MKHIILNQEIISEKISLERLQKEHKELITHIKEKTYPNSVFYPERNGSPENTAQLMEAAACYIFKIYKFWSSDIHIMKMYSHLEDRKHLKVYTMNYKNEQLSLAPIEEFHWLIKIKYVWKWAIENDLSVLSLEDFSKKFTGKKLFDFLKKEDNHFKQSPYHNTIHLLNVKELKIKNIVAVIQKKENYY